MDVKATLTGKNVSGAPLAVKSSVPDACDASINGILHTSWPWPVSWLPSQLWTAGGGAPGDRGTVIVTLLSSRLLSSIVYSMLTSQLPAPSSCGQQLTGEKILIETIRVGYLIPFIFSEAKFGSKAFVGKKLDFVLNFNNWGTTSNVVLFFCITRKTNLADKIIAIIHCEETIRSFVRKIRSVDV